MRDVPGSLRVIGQQDANEIGEVALTLGEMMVVSLQEFYETLLAIQSGGGDATTNDYRNNYNQNHNNYQTAPQATVKIEELSTSNDDENENKE
jgi:hypothetical protein